MFVLVIFFTLAVCLCLCLFYSFFSLLLDFRLVGLPSRWCFDARNANTWSICHVEFGAFSMVFPKTIRVVLEIYMRVVFFAFFFCSISSSYFRSYSLLFRVAFPSFFYTYSFILILLLFSCFFFSYSHEYQVPERVRAMNATIKLLLIVREPVTRAISDYTQLRSHAATATLPQQPPPPAIAQQQQQSSVPMSVTSASSSSTPSLNASK